MKKKKIKFSTFEKLVGGRIKSIRLLQNKTLEEWGKIFGASKGNALLWEQGKVLPSKARLEKIAKIGNTSVNRILFGDCEEFLDLNFIYYHMLYNIPVEQDGLLLSSIVTKIGLLAEQKGYSVDDLESLGIFYKDNYDIIRNKFKPKENLENKIDELVNKICFIIKLKISDEDTLKKMIKKDILEFIVDYNEEE